MSLYDWLSPCKCCCGFTCIYTLIPRLRSGCLSLRHTYLHSIPRLRSGCLTMRHTCVPHPQSIRVATASLVWSTHPQSVLLSLRHSYGQPIHEGCSCCLPLRHSYGHPIHEGCSCCLPLLHSYGHPIHEECSCCLPLRHTRYCYMYKTVHL